MNSASCNTHRIYIYNKNGVHLQTFGIANQRGSNPRQFWYPRGLTIDENYISL